jgi:hypothetical protein
MSDIAALKKQMEMMTAAMTELTMALKKGQKKSSSSSDDESVEKPKRPLSEGMKAWGAFQKRVAAVLKEGEVPLKNYAENMQFSSHLKSVNADYESWDNDEILEQRESWVKPEISKLAAAGKTKRPPSSKSSVASSSNDEAEKVVEEMEKLIKEEKKKKPKKKAEKAEEEKKPDEKAVEKKPRGRPSKKAAKEEETEEYTGDINAFKWKGKMFSKTTYNDVIDEDTYAYIGRWDESTNLINEKHPMPAYVKKLLADLEEANA